MKYIKSFALLGVMALFAACSSDDASYNSNESVTLGFADTEIVKKENSGMFNVPITIEGQRNGDISLDIEVIPDGANPATEDVHYLITTKHLQLLNDTTSTETLNVQIKTVDDAEINEARKFTLKIINVQGAKLQNDEVAITLRDNDAAFFEKFFGKWTLKYTVEGSTGAEEVEKTMIISGPADEDNPDYDKVLTATCAGMFNVGVSLDATFRFNYTFDTVTKKGSLGLIMGDLVAEYGSSYQWTFVNFVYDAAQNDYIGGYEDYVTDWSLGENDAFPTSITFPTDDVMYMALYQPGAGTWRFVYNLSMTKQ